MKKEKKNPHEPLQSGTAERNVSAGDDKTHEMAAAVQNELFH